MKKETSLTRVGNSGHRLFMLVFSIMMLVLFSACGSEEQAVVIDENTPRYEVKITPVIHGDISISPDLRPGESVPEGTQFTVSVEVDDGYILDTLFYMVAGPWGDMYVDSTNPEMSFRLTADSEIGAYIIDEDELAGIEVTQDVVYAQPGVKELKYDVYKPVDAQNLPLVVIVHGGGWSSNDENIMRGMAREIAKTGRYVAVSIDYRWIGNLDGDEQPNLVTDLINDVYGALAHIYEHAGDYGADNSRIAITGDSAGGHLSASLVTMIERLGVDTDQAEAVHPTYMPRRMSEDALREALLTSVKVAAPSYGVFSFENLESRSEQEFSPEAIAPLSNIPSASERLIPHFLVRGTADPLISYDMVADYADALEAAGQPVRHIEVEGAGHAFYDWSPSTRTRRTFEEIGIPHIHMMLDFFDQYL